MRQKLNSLLFAFSCITFFLLSPLQVFADGGVDLIVHYIEGSPLSDKVGYSVSISLSALQSNGSAITGLSKDDFRITEDSHQVEIDQINTSNNLPINVLVLLDTSGSMQGSPIQDARNAAAGFLLNFNEQDQVAAATFNEQFNYISDFTNDNQQLSNKVNQINAVDLASTCLYDAAYSAVQKMATVESGRRAVILLTDGQDYKSGSTCSVHTLDDVINLASEGSTRVPIYIIALGNEVDEKSLQRLAEMSGGIYQYTPSSNQLQNAFNNLSSQLRTQYILSYTSNSAPGAHTVAVEMKYDNQVVQDTRSFTLPALAQTLTIISPTDGQEIKGTSKLAISISGSGETIEKVVFYLGDDIIGSDTTIPYELDYEFNNDQLGAGIISATAVNSEGENIVSSQVNVNIIEAASSSPITITKSLLDNPLYLVLGIFGIVATAAVIIILSKRKKKSEPVFADTFELRENNKSDDSRTIDFSEYSHDEKHENNETLAILSILFSDDVAMIGQQLNITHFPSKVGRGASNDIVISSKDVAVSRDHILLEKRGNSIILLEMISKDERGNPKYPTYGTFVNERSIRDQTVTLNEGDEIRLGSRFKMRFNSIVSSTGSEDKTIDSFELTSDKTRELSQDDEGTREIPRE